MKKLLVLLISLLLVFTCFGCTKPENNPVNPDNPDNPDTPSVNFEINLVESEDGKTLTFSSMDVNLEILEKHFDLTDEYQAACAIIFTLAKYETDKEEALKMLDYVMGPETHSKFDEDFLKNQFEQYPYVIRSYFDGSTPDNNYLADYKEGSVTLKVTENIYSRSEENYVNLFFTSGGADSARSVKLRKKESTGQWFLFSDTYKGLCSGIRQPAADDKWN